MPALLATEETAPAAAPGDALLGVTRSFSGRCWRLRPAETRLALAVAQRHGLPEAVARLLAARGIMPEAVPDYLEPTLRAVLPDPSSFKDMDRAAARLAAAVMAGEPVALFADYDVDGACSAAILARLLTAAGSPPRIHVPDRIAEGYGPNTPALQRLAGEGVRLVVCVDCGTTAQAPLEAAAAAGLDVIVLDHHTPEARLPPAVAVVNPNRLDESGAHRQLAACGVAFLAAVAVNRALRRAGHYRGRAEPDLLALLDLVALGTICDVVPLTGLNRALVRQGLKVMAARRNVGLAALADAAGLAEKVAADHAAFLLGPRINAGGRIGRADLGARLLAGDDPVAAAEMAALLDTHNEDRKAIEAAVWRHACEQVEQAEEPGPVLVVAAPGWHPGVVGIVAGRLRERYHRPACVVALDGGVGHASARSVPGFDIGAAVAEARRAGLLITGGGHPMAAGFRVAAARLPAVRTFLADRLRAGPAGLAGPPVPLLELDGALRVGGVTVELAGGIARLGPFGAGNAEPRFAVLGVRPVQPRVVGVGHVACWLTGADGGRLKAIAFRAADTDLGRALLAGGGAPLHLAGTLRVDDWGGRQQPQILIEDGAPVWGG